MTDLDIGAYLARIGLDPSPRPEPTVEWLTRLQHHHLCTVPFENLDIPLGRGISLDPSDVADKVIRRRRGGYCFELNSLFGRLLDALGFERHPVRARVWYRAPVDVPGQTHTANLVTIGARRYLSDVGFGGQTPRLPVPFEEGTTLSDVDGTVMLRALPGHGLMLSRDHGGTVVDQFSTDGARAHAADLEIANHFTATHPASVFRNGRVVASLFTEEGRITLEGRTLTRRRGLSAEKETISSPATLRHVLTSQFNLDSGEDLETLYDTLPKE